MPCIRSEPIHPVVPPVGCDGQTRWPTCCCTVEQRSTLGQPSRRVQDALQALWLWGPLLCSSVKLGMVPQNGLLTMLSSVAVLHKLTLRSHSSD